MRTAVDRRRAVPGRRRPGRDSGSPWCWPSRPRRPSRRCDRLRPRAAPRRRGRGSRSPRGPGCVIARAGLRPVERLTVAAENVAATERLDPIEVQGSDEIARLTAAFNAMLGALAASRDRQRALVADAGHELRTPLTSLRTNLDLLAQSEPRVPGSPAAATARRAARRRPRPGGRAERAGRRPGRAGPRGPADRRDARAGRPGRRRRRAVERVARRAPDVRFDTDVRPWRAARRRRSAWSGPSPTCSTTPPSGARPGGTRRRRSPAPTACCRSATRARASPTRTCRTSSTGSTARPRPARCPGPASAWRSSGRPSSATAAPSRPPARRGRQLRRRHRRSTVRLPRFFGSLLVCSQGLLRPDAATWVHDRGRPAPIPPYRTDVTAHVGAPTAPTPTQLAGPRRDRLPAAPRRRRRPDPDQSRRRRGVTALVAVALAAGLVGGGAGAAVTHAARRRQPAAGRRR